MAARSADTPGTTVARSEIAMSCDHLAHDLGAVAPFGRAARRRARDRGSRRARRRRRARRPLCPRPARAACTSACRAPCRSRVVVAVGRHHRVGWRPPSARQILGQAPVDQDRLAEAADQHVGRLQVAVDDALAVRVGHRLGDGDDVGQERQPFRSVCLDLMTWSSERPTPASSRRTARPRASGPLRRWARSPDAAAAP